MKSYEILGWLNKIAKQSEDLELEEQVEMWEKVMTALLDTFNNQLKNQKQVVDRLTEL